MLRAARLILNIIDEILGIHCCVWSCASASWPSESNGKHKLDKNTFHPCVFACVPARQVSEMLCKCTVHKQMVSPQCGCAYGVLTSTLLGSSCGNLGTGILSLSLDLLSLVPWGSDFPSDQQPRGKFPRGEEAQNQPSLKAPPHKNESPDGGGLSCCSPSAGRRPLGRWPTPPTDRKPILNFRPTKAIVNRLSFVTITSPP